MTRNNWQGGKGKGQLMNIAWKVSGDIDEEVLRIAVQYLNGFIQNFCPTGAKYIESICFIPKDNIEEWITGIHRRIDENAPIYRFGPHKPNAVAVPFVEQTDLACSIIISHQLVELLSDLSKHCEFASAGLEEVFHVEQYALTWENGEWYKLNWGYNSEEPLYGKVVHLLDEYWVTRKKIPILANLFRRARPDGTEEPFYDWYGGDLVSRLEEAPRLLADSKNDPLEIFHRYIFEPLTRDVAFRTQNPTEPEPGTVLSPENSSFFCRSVQKYWREIERALREFFESTRSKESSVFKIAAQIKKCMAEYYS